MTKTQLCQMEALVSRVAAMVRNRTPSPPRRLQTAQDVIDLLQEQVEALRAETQSDVIQKARALGYLADLARKAIETSSLAARVEALERGPETETGHDEHQQT